MSDNTLKHRFLPFLISSRQTPQREDWGKSERQTQLLFSCPNLDASRCHTSTPLFHTDSLCLSSSKPIWFQEKYTYDGARSNLTTSEKLHRPPKLIEDETAQKEINEFLTRQHHSIQDPKIWNQMFTSTLQRYLSLEKINTTNCAQKYFKISEKINFLVLDFVMHSEQKNLLTFNDVKNYLPKLCEMVLDSDTGIKLTKRNEIECLKNELLRNPFWLEIPKPKTGSAQEYLKEQEISFKIFNIIGNKEN